MIIVVLILDDIIYVYNNSIIKYNLYIYIYIYIQVIFLFE